MFGPSVARAPEFMVTHVHAMPPDSDPFEGNYTVSDGFYRGGVYELRHATIMDLIHIAWSVDAAKVVGGPNWVSLDKFDVVRAAPEDTALEDLNLMLLGLLKDVARPQGRPRLANLAHESSRRGAAAIDL
jgi:uncharacterized protein (TIGR03435 family)